MQLRVRRYISTTIENAFIKNTRIKTKYARRTFRLQKIHQLRKNKKKVSKPKKSPPLGPQKKYT